jgi:hypothetical protein
VEHAFGKRKRDEEKEGKRIRKRLDFYSNS